MLCLENILGLHCYIVVSFAPTQSAFRRASLANQAVVRNEVAAFASPRAVLAIYITQ